MIAGFSKVHTPINYNNMHTFYRKLRLYNDFILIWAIKIYTCASICSYKDLPVLWQVIVKQFGMLNVKLCPNIYALVFYVLSF